MVPPLCHRAFWGERNKQQPCLLSATRQVQGDAGGVGREEQVWAGAETARQGGGGAGLPHSSLRPSHPAGWA